MEEMIAQAVAAGMPRAMAVEALDLAQHALSEAGIRAIEICSAASSRPVRIAALHIWAQQMAAAAAKYAAVLEAEFTKPLQH